MSSTKSDSTEPSYEGIDAGGSAVIVATGGALPPGGGPTGSERVDYLDATRAFALLLGIVFHASLSFMPVFVGWAVQDVSTSPLVLGFILVSHSFRMEVFFLLSGFLACRVVQRNGAPAFIRSRAVRLLVPFVVGWFALRPLVVSGWIMGRASLQGEVDILAALRSGFGSLKALPAGLFTGTHLWFLYYLALVTAATLLLRAAVIALGPLGTRWVARADAATAWLAASRGKLLILVPLTALVLLFMRQWGMDTPDRSLVPHLPVTAIYGGIFLLGWMLARQADLLDHLARASWALGAAAVAGVVVSYLLMGFQFQPGHARQAQAHMVFVFAYALMMWSFILLTLGLCRKVCLAAQRRSPDASRGLRGVIRYLADSSYWLYLAHLPLVVWGQVAVAELPLHWSFKLALLSLGCVALLLVTYDLLVRPTLVGQILNGRRKPRAFGLRLRAGALSPT